MDISFNFIEKITLNDRTLLKGFIKDIFKKEKKKATSLTFVFCSDDYLLQINKTYLHHNYYTDIITFDLSNPSLNEIYGEIYISVETIRSNSQRFNTTIKSELHRVIFHGILHLCGYMDKNTTDQNTMTGKEDFYLTKYVQYLEQKKTLTCSTKHSSF